MNEVFVCIECGEIGNKNDLSFYEATIFDNEVMNKLISKNKLGALKCPSCGSSNVFYSRPATMLGIIEKKEWVPAAPDEVGIHIAPTHTDIMQIQKAMQQPHPAQIVKENKDIQEQVRVDTAVRFNNKCDLCKLTFECKIDGATRCPECLKKLVQ